MTDETPERTGPVVRLDRVRMTHVKNGDAFEAFLGSVAGPAGARHVGMRLCVVPPGKSAWPFHCHHANDEVFVILDGEGTLRFGRDEHPFRSGDVLVRPAGGRETGHRILDTGAADLGYLSVSSMREPDVMECADSGKWGAFAGAAPGGDPASRTFSAFVRADAEVGYWEGEGEVTG